MKKNEFEKWFENNSQCGVDIDTAEENISEVCPVHMYDSGIDDGLDDGDYLMYASYSVECEDGCVNVKLYYPQSSRIVTAETLKAE